MLFSSPSRWRHLFPRRPWWTCQTRRGQCLRTANQSLLKNLLLSRPRQRSLKEVSATAAQPWRQPSPRPRNILISIYLYLFHMKTLPTLNCVYPDLVLKLLTSWPTVRFLRFLTDQHDRTWCHLSPATGTNTWTLAH